jgi:hypothetical protein
MLKHFNAYIVQNIQILKNVTLRRRQRRPDIGNLTHKLNLTLFLPSAARAPPWRLPSALIRGNALVSYEQADQRRPRPYPSSALRGFLNPRNHAGDGRDQKHGCQACDRCRKGVLLVSRPRAALMVLPNHPFERGAAKSAGGNRPFETSLGAH